MVFSTKDTHVPRKGRDLIRTTLEDAKVTCSVSLPGLKWLTYNGPDIHAVSGSSSAACVRPRRALQRTMGCGIDSIPLQFHDGSLRKNSWGRFGTSSDRKHRTDTCLLNPTVARPYWIPTRILVTNNFCAHIEPYPKHTRHKAAIAGIAEILIHVKSWPAASFVMGYRWKQSV